MLSLLSEIEKGTKSALMKKRIISYIMSNDNVTNTELAKVLNLSVPTVSKFIEELSAAGIVRERGKLATNGGRHPLLYGLNPESCYFAGVDMKNGAVSVGLIDFAVIW